jgi:hypothetical protein
VGNNVVGGKGKKIYWNMVKDKAVIEDEIYVQVLATALPDATAAPGQEPAAQQQSVKQEKVFSKGGAIALSAIVPGLGISKLRDGGAYWLICLPVYGLAAGGIVLNVMSNSTYDKYKNSTDGSERSSLYDKAVSQNKTGNTLLWVAGGLWLADLIITAVVPAKPKFGYSLGPGWDPNINQPMLTFRCRIGK